MTGNPTAEAPRRMTALLSAAALGVPPLIGLALAIKEKSPRGLAFSVFFLAASVPSAFGIARGKAWGSVLGTYISGAGLLTVILHGISSGFSMMHAVPAAVYGVLFATLNMNASVRPPDRKKEEKRGESETLALWGLENAEAIVVAFVMALLIRCFCIEIFQIPSSSMEPTLMGSIKPEHDEPGECAFLHTGYHVDKSGDRIMVSKFYYAVTPIRRFDVVVFKFPLNQMRNFIKRVVGLPDEHLLIHQGDIYYRPRGEAKFRIARKPPLTQESVWIRTADVPGFMNDREGFDKCWESAPADGPSSAEYQVQSNELTTLESRGERGIRFFFKPHIVGGDARVTFTFELTGGGRGQVFAEIAGAHGRFELRLGAGEPGSFRYHAPGSERSAPTINTILPDSGLKPDRRHTLDLSVYDGTAWARLGGKVLEKIDFIDTFEKPAEPRSAFSGKSTDVSFGARGLTVKVRDLDVNRDIFYFGKRMEVHGGEKKDLRAYPLGEDDGDLYIPPGNYVMMGDNTQNSHDSRLWTSYVYRVKDRPEPIECDVLATSEYDDKNTGKVQDLLGLESPPAIAIEADQYGNPHALSRRDLVETELRDSPFVDEKFIVGKAFWVWWPVGRSFRMIR